MAMIDDIVGKWYFHTPMNSELFESDVECYLTFESDGRLLIEAKREPNEAEPDRGRVWCKYHLNVSSHPIQMQWHSFEHPEYSPDMGNTPIPEGPFPGFIVEMPDRDTLRICGADMFAPEPNPHQFGPETADFKRVG